MQAESVVSLEFGGREDMLMRKGRRNWAERFRLAGSECLQRCRWKRLETPLLDCSKSSSDISGPTFALKGTDGRATLVL